MLIGEIYEYYFQENKKGTYLRGVICLILVKYSVGRGGDVLVNKGGGSEGDKTICHSLKVSSLSVLQVLKP